ncbi:hypothetical protein ACLKA7_005715 [Drosophila subpalustris]
MPIGVFKSVREVSSEDAVHLACNLLKENAGKKWKTQQTGEKSAHVILEFEEPQQITGIDIGNEHAAFVEVLVSKSGCQPQDFKEILLSSSFMTPIESKNSSNLNRVRCFSGDALSANLLHDKWKLVKIVCTQPFNRHVQYGLSFIKVHVVGTTTAAAKVKSLVPDKFKLVQLKLREESPDSEPEGKTAASTLFQRWKASRASASASEISTAAAIRDAVSSHRPVPRATTTTTASKTETEIETKQQLDRNRNALLFGDDEPDDIDIEMDAKKQRLSKHIEADKNRRRLELERERERELEKKKAAKSKRQSIESPKPAAVPKESPKPAHAQKKRLSSNIEDELSCSPAKKQKIKAVQTIKYVPFNQLLSGVVLVISGIQNPDRGDLRAKAVALGAKYKADWEAGCTHLICAFRNTPKYNQVKGKGKIVTRSWIEKCYALKKYLPWRRYALDTTELGQPESDEELFDESLKPTVDDNDNDVEMEMKEQMQQANSSDPDTEDELERVAQLNKLKTTRADEHQNDIKKKTNDSSQKQNSKSQNVYEISTDEEDYVQELRKK